MKGIALSSFLLAIIALSISFANSHDTRSYLSALQSHPSVMNRRPEPKEPIPPPFRTNNHHRSSGSNLRGGCRNKYDLDYIQLTLQWAPGFCATSPQKCTRLENRFFTIHGMWPQYYQTSNPEFCCFDNNFNYNLIQSLLPQLNEYWFSAFNDDSRSFWAHEWMKHGTCSRDVKQLRGEKAYFSTTLDKFNSLPILKTLRQANIVPNDQTPYNSVDIQNALKKLTGGKRVIIECDYEAHQPIPLLKGIDFCYDTNLAFVDCPPKYIRCQKRLLFLSR